MAPGPARICWGDPRNKPSFLSSTSFWYQNIDSGQPQGLRFALLLFFFINPDVWNCSCCSFKKVRFVVVVYPKSYLVCTFCFVVLNQSYRCHLIDNQLWLLVVIWCTLHYLWLPCCCSLWLPAVLSCCSMNCCWYS